MAKWEVQVQDWGALDEEGPPPLDFLTFEAESPEAALRQWIKGVEDWLDTLTVRFADEDHALTPCFRLGVTLVVKRDEQGTLEGGGG